MANKTLTINITADEQVITSGLDSFCRAYGWTDKVIGESGEEIENPVSQEDLARGVVARFFRETISAYNAQKMSERARLATIEQTKGVLDSAVLDLAIK